MTGLWFIYNSYIVYADCVPTNVMRLQSSSPVWLPHVSAPPLTMQVMVRNEGSVLGGSMIHEKIITFILSVPQLSFVLEKIYHLDLWFK